MRWKQESNEEETEVCNEVMEGVYVVTRSVWKLELNERKEEQWSLNPPGYCFAAGSEVTLGP